MTTELLEGSKTGAQERQKTSDAIPREPIYPARVKLAAKAAEFERAEADLEDYRGKAARAQRDETQALESTELSEEQAAQAISRAQNLRSVYLSRTQNKEKALEALAPELAAALNESVGELRQVVNLELQRRKGIVTARVLESIEAIGGGARREMAIGQLLEFSGPVQRVAVLGPAPYIYTKNETGLGASARAILEAFEQLTVELKREI